MKKPANSHRILFYFWILLLFTSAMSLCWQLRDGVNQRIETNLLKLLPETEQQPAVMEAIASFTTDLSKRMLFLLSAGDRDQTRAAAKLLGTSLTSCTSFESVSYQIDGNEEKEFYDLYFPYRFQLLTKENQEALKAPLGIERLSREAAMNLNSPMSPLYSRIAEKDPFFLFPAFLEGLPRPPGRTRLDEGMLTFTGEDGQVYIMVAATLKETPFARASQKTAIRELTETETLVRNSFPEVELISGGTLRFAESSATQAEHDATTISIISMVAILLLCWLSFKSLYWLLLGVLPVLSGMLLAITCCFFIYDRVHMITMGFGASLIGICIDYTFHYFSDRVTHRNSGMAEDTLRRIFPGITLGVLTSILGYAGLFIAPFSGLRQMALFASIGLFGAYGTVCILFPYFSGRETPAPGPLAYGIIKVVPHWRSFLRSGPWKAIFLLLALFSIIGIFRLSPDDDVRRLQKLDPELVVLQQKIGELTGGAEEGKFLVVTGETPEILLKELEHLEPVLAELQQNNIIGYFQTLANWVPSEQSQMESFNLLRTRLVEEGALHTHLEMLGFYPNVETEVLQSLKPESFSPLTVQNWLDSPASKNLQFLWTTGDSGMPASIVFFSNLKDEMALRAAIGNRPDVYYISQTASYTDLFRRYRHIATRLVLCSYIGIWLLVSLRYSFRNSFRIMLPAVLAASFSLGMLGWTSLPVNIFNMLALLLVLGIGIDYAIFFAEAKDEEETKSVAIAVVISALSTLFSFGLLALSNTIFLKSFGLTVWLGLGAAMFLAPLAASFKEKNHANPS